MELFKNGLRNEPKRASELKAPAAITTELAQPSAGGLLDVILEIQAAAEELAELERRQRHAERCEAEMAEINEESTEEYERAVGALEDARYDN